ncbi:PepSY-like domain-containing protein [uncultured Bacteroides sp.]|uniref:PepSY-like domain-containing protein n=1 Tax=uncultured Bacteroides sp. TaxID=162156 RepID=UPI0026705FAE|nr:PepSY-like domain-containing protein [uncultured Bacteroides sp.]
MNNRFEKLIFFPFVIGIIILGACSDNVWNELPSPLTSFIERYYPGSGVSQFMQDDNCYKVKINNGATLIFDSEYNWLSIDGNGVRLPEVIVYDEVPPALFSYLQGTAQQGSVYRMRRDKNYYKLTMEDTVITYDISSGKVTYPDGTTLDS